MDDKWTLRGGYSWGEAPIPSEAMYSNAFAPIIIEHYASFGFSYKIDKKWEISGAYIHGFENSVTDNGSEIPGALNTEVSSICGYSKFWSDLLFLEAFEISCGNCRHSFQSG